MKDIILCSRILILAITYLAVAVVGLLFLIPCVVYNICVATLKFIEIKIRRIKSDFLSN